MPGLKLYLLGSPRLVHDGHNVEMDTRKALALLAYLAISGGSHARDGLAALLWPDYDEAGARGAFRRTLSTLHKAVGESTLEVSRENVGLALDADLWVDALKFRSLIAGCQAHPHGKQEVCRDCLPLLQEAAALYQGDFMAGFSLRDSANFDDWQFFQAEAFRQELAGVLQRLARGLAALGDYDEAIQAARRWLALDALREEAHRQLMQLYEWSGQHGAALRQYRECVRVLDQQLGVPPLEETTRLYETIQARQLSPTATLAPDSSATPVKTETPETAHGESAAEESRSDGYPLVGRGRELQALWQAYQSTRTDGRFFALQGEAGIGKTRLALEFLAQAEAAGTTTITARCYEGEENLAYAPVIEALRAAIRCALADPDGASRLRQVPPVWLAETARLLPELAAELNLTVSPWPPANSLSGEGPGAQNQFLEGLCQTLTVLCQGRSTGVLFLDDVHWADNATLDLLTYFARRLAGRSLFILVAWREDLISAEHKLRRLMAEARRAGTGTLMTLMRLERAAVDELVRAALPEEARRVPSLAARIFQEAEGLPFFVTKYLETFEAAGHTDMQDWALPPSVQDMLQARLNRANETGWQLLSSAAVIGRSFTYDILRAASGRSEFEVVEGLEHLARLGLIEELRSRPDDNTVAYDFTHDKLRQLVYDQTSLARRRLLHQRAADAYTGLIRQRREASAQAAYHYQLAGAPAKAAEYFKRSGDDSRAVYANRDAIAHYHSALTCGYARPAELHEAIGDLQALSAEYRAALTSYETAAALCAPERLPWIEHRLGVVHHQRGDWDLAECHFEAAASALDQNKASEEMARVLVDWSRTAYRRMNYAQAQELAQRALSLAEACDDRRALARAENMLGLLARSRQDYAGAIAYLRHSLEITDEQADAGGRAAALNNLARVHAEGGDYPQAIDLTQQALELCLQQGDRHRAAALRNNLADLYHATGNSQAAMEHLKLAVAAFAEIGLEAGEQKPEIWMLTEW